MKVFGTDGIRDSVEGPLLQPEFVHRLGKAIGKWVQRHPKSAASHVIIGRDTRTSGGAIFLTLARGLDEEQIRIFDAGVCPTPAVASAVQQLDLDLGIVITASHNPASDNGIKLFGPGGFKLREEEEAEIEALIDQIPPPIEGPLSPAPSVRYFEARRHYLERWESLLPEKSLMGLRIVVDSSNGATCQTTGELLSRFGAQVFPIGNEPDGKNINEGIGSEHPDAMCQSVRETGAALGIAHDGDGDRVILSDENGNVIDGDAVLAILGTGWGRTGMLEGNALVATIMSNLGLDRCMEAAGLSVMRVGVGDRQVFYAMREHGFVLGGESSGHFIAMNHLPTGDGLLAALLVIREMQVREKPLSELAKVFAPFPQLKKNLHVKEKPPLDSIPGIREGLARMEADLGNRGRVLLRYSGTEPRIRLLAEAEDPDLAGSTMGRLEELVRQHISLA